MKILALLESSQDLPVQLYWPLRLAPVDAERLVLVIPVASLSKPRSKVRLDEEAGEGVPSEVLAEVRAELDAFLGHEGWLASEPEAPEPEAPEPKAPEPKAPEPKAPEPKAPEPKAPEPKAPEPKAPEPKAPEPKAHKDGEVAKDAGAAEDVEVVVPPVVELVLVRAGGANEALAELAREGTWTRIVLVQSRLEGDESESTALRRGILADAPAEVVLVRPGKERTGGGGLLVPVARGPHCKTALSLGRELAGREDSPVTALYVEPDVGADSLRVGRRILKRILEKALGEEADEMHAQVVLDSQVHRGIAEAYERGNFGPLVLGASKSNFVPWLRGTVSQRLLRGAPEHDVLVVRATIPLANRARRLLEGLLQRSVPQLEREQRVSLVERVQSNSEWDFDFVVLTALSTLIAGLGLIDDSAAVIIGAMLVAPLMTPLLGIGLALVQGNPHLMQTAMRTVTLGFITAFGLGLFLGVIHPGFEEPSREMATRDWPGLLDLSVAFVAGLAAAYASSRPSLLAALPGVAIAAALVPPIATAGLAAAVADWELAIGAALLFLANMVAIALASAASLWAVGLRYTKVSSRVVRLAGGGLSVLAVALAISFSLRPPPTVADDPPPEELVEAVREELRSGLRLRSMELDLEPEGWLLMVHLSGPEPPPERLSKEIAELAREHLEGPGRVRVEAFLEQELEVTE